MLWIGAVLVIVLALAGALWMWSPGVPRPFLDGSGNVLPGSLADEIGHRPHVLPRTHAPDRLEPAGQGRRLVGESHADQLVANVQTEVPHRGSIP